MNIGFYSATSGVIAMQTGLDVVSNNIANVSTNGYKTLRSSFSDLVYKNQRAQYEEAQTGMGVKVSKTDLMYKPGQLLLTERELDFATPTEGLFAVSDAAGDVKYTKDGSFYIRENGENWELVNADGLNVLGYDGEIINANFNEDNTIDYTDIQDRLGVFMFDNPHGLLATGANTYSQTLSSGEATADRGAVKLMGALELSTVDLAEQMVKVIQLQRAFQFNSKMVQTSDELQTIVNNLRR